MEADVTDITEARRLFPATTGRAYFNTAAVGLASRRLAETYHAAVDEWVYARPRLLRGERAANQARAAAARLIGADPADLALIPSVSSAAGLVAAQLGVAGAGENVVIGEREYSSNHFPWRQLAHKGYDVRQVPFRQGGLDPEDVGRRIDGGTRLVAFSGVQSATGHRSDIAAISTLARDVGAIVFVDASQMVGALPVAPELAARRRAGHGRPQVPAQRGPRDGLLLPVPSDAGAVHPRSTPAGGRARTRSPASTARRCSSPPPPHVSTARSAGSPPSATRPPSTSRALRTRRRPRPQPRARANSLRAALAGVGWDALDLPAANRSTIVSIPLGDLDPARLVRALADDGVVCSARDGALRLSVHFYNHEDDIERLVTALASQPRPGG